MVSRHYIVGAVVIVLLMWGPLDHDSPWGLAIRLGYLVLVPLIVWVGLMWLWRRWKPDEASEDRLQRTLEGMASGVMLAWVIIRLEDGYQRREDTDAIFFQIIFGSFFFYLSMMKDKDKKS